jgi:hypothetical protein
MRGVAPMRLRATPASRLTGAGMQLRALPAVQLTGGGMWLRTPPAVQLAGPKGMWPPATLVVQPHGDSFTAKLP